VVSVEKESIAHDFQLHQNYPNPFNPSTTISFTLNKSGQVRLSIYDALGRLVNVLLDGQLSEGPHTIKWNSTNFSGASVVSGVYIYRITVQTENKQFSQSHKMLLIK
jgi:flagellar hook assembly protein FlgD